MRSMQWQLGVLGTISAFAYRNRETKKKNKKEVQLINNKKLGNARRRLLASATLTTSRPRNDVASDGRLTKRGGSQKTWIFEAINVAQGNIFGCVSSISFISQILTYGVETFHFSLQLQPESTRFRFLGAYEKLRKATIKLYPESQPFHQSARNTSAPAGRDFIKTDK